ncbi:MAG: tyrosine-type recombinase/integrase [Polyangiaceae bacterium]|nr:tyrosine-type recombinase/integrase [Polyangiaceae bacterium]
MVAATEDFERLRALLARAKLILAEMDNVVATPTRVASVGAVPVESFEQWAECWFERRGAVGVERERRAFERWIAPYLGAIGVAALARGDVERWVEQLDRAVSSRRLRWSTAWRVWIVLRTMLRDLSRSKHLDLRLRADLSVHGVRGPDRGSTRSSTFLYPSEFSQLMAAQVVPLGRRRVYALATYLALRASELVALRWADLDLKRRQVCVSQSRDRSTGRVRATKSGQARQDVLPAELLPLLRQMQRSATLETVVSGRIPPSLARELRADLLAAGCDRSALHASTDTERPLTFHDLRATGITWMAMRGDSVTEIMERAGHAQLATTQGYLRRGRLLAVARGERPFPRLPRCLLHP